MSSRRKFSLEDSSLHSHLAKQYIVIPDEWKGFLSNVAINIQYPTIVIVIVANSRLLFIIDLVLLVYR